MCAGIKKKNTVQFCLYLSVQSKRPTIEEYAYATRESTTVFVIIHTSMRRQEFPLLQD
jgi:hypothetical protein